MLKISFFLLLIVLFYGAGRAFFDLIHYKPTYLSFTLPSCCGVVVVTIAVTWYYQLGGNLNRFFWIISIIIGCFLLWRLLTLRANLLRLAYNVRFEILAMAGFSGAIILPAVLGGEQFTIFRGNHHDSFNYLEAAITYRNLSFAQANSLNTVELVRKGLFAFGHENLRYRPEVTFLYATLSSFHPGDFIRLHYILLVYFQFLSFCGVRAVAAELLPTRRIVPHLFSFALVGGFWGQYILDIDSWSQSACMPLIMLSLLLLIKLAQTTGESENLTSDPKLIMLYAIAWVGMFYLYPEAACFLLPAHIICWVMATRLFKSRTSWLTAGATGLAAFGLLLPVFQSNIAFIVGQSGVSLSGVNWWRYYQAFFFGRDGGNSDLFSNAADFAAGALGLYFVTPYPAMNPVVAAGERTLILSCAIVLIIRLVKGIRFQSSPTWWLLASYVGASLLVTLGFCTLQQYWSAGKAFSYVAYAVLLLLIAPAFLTSSSDRSWLNPIAIAIATAFLLLQLAFFFYRPVASCKPFGIHYAPPYPSIADPHLKTMINFADWSFLRHLRSGDHPAVQIEDPFIQSFVRILLLSHHVKFCLEPPVFASSSRLSIVPTGDCAKSAVRLVAANSATGPFSVQLSLIAPATAP